MKGLILSVLMLVSTAAFSAENKCTEWTKTRGVTCIFAGGTGYVYERQCENPCWYNSRTRRGNMGPGCDQERVCFTRNPEEFERAVREAAAMAAADRRTIIGIADRVPVDADLDRLMAMPALIEQYTQRRP